MNPDNTPEKKAAYKLKLEGLSDDALRKECNDKIWFSAYASNNPRSCYHWQCDATHDECQRRGKPKIYAQEHAALMAEARG